MITVGTRLRAGLLLLLVGGTGFVGGLLVERLVLSGPLPSDADPAAWTERPVTIIRGAGDDVQPGQRLFRLGLPQELAEELDLTDEQRAEIERIVAEDQAALRAVTAELEPTMRAIIDRSRERIQAVLTDEQREGWVESRVLRLRSPDGGPQGR